ncbi:hypothetical protein [uncultured Mediterranean phage]|nr:hypothetical protein [uncultured Mediterranean phage]
MGMDVYGRRESVGEPPVAPRLQEYASDEENAAIRAAWHEKYQAWRDQPGAYFRASVWSWRPIQDLMRQLCSDFLDEELLEHMGYNEGAGPGDQETCDKIAARFSKWMEHNVNGHEADLGMYVDEQGKFVELTPSEDSFEGEAERQLVDAAQQALSASDKPVARTAHSIDDESLKAWIEFLQHCGGFMVF